MKKVLLVIMTIMMFMFSSVALAKDFTPAQKQNFDEISNDLGYGTGVGCGIVDSFNDIYNNGKELRFNKSSLSNNINNIIFKVDAVMPKIQNIPFEIQGSARKVATSEKMNLTKLKNAFNNINTNNVTFFDYLSINQIGNSLVDDLSGLVSASEIYTNNGEEAPVRNSAYQKINLGDYYYGVMIEFECHPSTLISSNMKENEIVEVYSWKGVNNTKIIITFRNYRVVAKKIQ